MTPAASDSEETRLALRNTEVMVRELLNLCLERIGWKGAPEEWQVRLKEVLGRLQSRIASETEPFPLRMTSHQMDCLIHLCRAASVGDEASMHSRTLLLQDAFPFLKKHDSIEHFVFVL
jgi:hypothetical protein